MEDIYIVTSFTNTLPGKAIQLRAAMKFWDRYPGDCYSHVSLSRDSKLGNMLSFARKEMKNPLNSGMVKEDIRSKMFVQSPEKNIMAVMELKVSEEQYQTLSNRMEQYWENHELYGFNFAALATMLFCGKGIAPKNRYLCSQFVATVLKESGIEIFKHRNPKDIKPFDFYGTLKNNIIYEGLVVGYPEYATCASTHNEQLVEHKEKQLIRKLERSNVK